MPRAEESLADLSKRFFPDLLEELERRRPGAPLEREADESPIDWWHYAAFAAGLRAIDGGQPVLIAEADAAAMQADFRNKEASESGEGRIWNLVLYAARLQEIGIMGSGQFKEYEAEALDHLVALKQKTEPHARWYLAYYAGHLAELSGSGETMFSASDWQAFSREAAELSASAASYDHNFILAQFLINLAKVDASKTAELIRQGAIDLPGIMEALRAEAVRNKSEGKEWMVMTYLENLKKLEALGL